MLEGEIACIREDVATLRAEIGKVIVGQDDIVEGVVVAMFTGGHVLLEGVPGLGKTKLVRTLADVLHLKFARVQFTPDLMPSDIVGTNVLVDDGQGHRTFVFQRGPVFTNILLADEVNRATPKTQSALLEAMQEQAVTVGKETYPLVSPFFVLATQNPIEMEGTYPLPEAQLDRFIFKLHVGFPTRDEMHAIMSRTTGESDQATQRVMTAERLLEIRQLARRCKVEWAVQDYAIRLVEATHRDRPTAAEPAKRWLRIGASPRGAQSMLLAAKVRALLDGRVNASRDDVRALVKPALRHRILLNFEAEAEGVTTDRVLDELVRAVPAS